MRPEKLSKVFSSGGGSVRFVLPCKERRQGGHQQFEHESCSCSELATFALSFINIQTSYGKCISGTLNFKVEPSFCSDSGLGLATCLLYSAICDSGLRPRACVDGGAGGRARMDSAT